MTLADWQDRVGSWSLTTFGPGDRLASCLEHMRRELVELEEAAPQDRGEEMADVLILLLTVAYRSDVDLEGVVAAKFARLQTRRWSEPDAAGVIEHVREDATNG